MTLLELLDELRTGVLRDTSDRIGGDSDQLWSDTSLIRYLDEAQKRFAKRTLMLRGYKTITTVAYQRDYQLDPTVIAVLSARFMGNGEWVNGAYTGGVYPDQADLGRGGHSQFDSYVEPDKYYFDVNNLSVVPPGKPMAFDTDEVVDEINNVSGVMSMRLYPLPSPDFAGCTVMIRALRLPTPLTPSNLAMTPEIPADYHLTLVEYAAYLALRMVDHEAGDPQRADDFLKMFNMHVEEARREHQRKMFSPQIWSFGRAAYSYTSN